MSKRIFNLKNLLGILLLVSLLLRLYRIDYPSTYVFDEVYHGFTAVQYSLGSREAWDYQTVPPKGVAFEWTHPPLAKEVMALSLLLFQTDQPWGWRLPGAFLGAVAIYLVFKLGVRLFQDQKTALLASFLFAFDGLNFVQSRTGMNDIYLVTFILASLLFFFNRRFLLSAIFLGLALASKWSAIYLLIFYLILFLYDLKILKKIYLFIFIPIVVYLLSYLPFFVMGYDMNQFLELQKQMFNYHTHLKAGHDYASAWWTWPLSLYPVWYHVEYFKDSIANIFTAGNPIVFWFGFFSIIACAVEFYRKKILALYIIVFGYLTFWLPWAASPRIMFLYHYSPSVPFLALALGYQINKLAKNNPQLLKISIFLVLLGFFALYPFLTGIPIPKSFVSLFFASNLAKDPFR